MNTSKSLLSPLVGLAGVAALGLGASTASAQFVFDQIGNENGDDLVAALIPASQDFEADFDTYDVIAIDDFTLSAETTTLTVFDAVLGGFNGYAGFEGVNSFSVRFYDSETDAGLDLDDTIYEASFAAPSLVIASDISPTTPDDLLRFGIDVTLGAGTYVVGLFPQNDFGTNGQTGIIDSNLGDFNSWQANPAGGFGFPPDGLQIAAANLAYRLATAVPCPDVSCVGDLNGDNTVDTQDLLILLAAWDMNDGNAACLAEPLDNTDTSDLLVLLAAFGPCPEPNNDECANATEIIGTGSFDDTLVGATLDGVEDCDGVVNDGPGRWFRFTSIAAEGEGLVYTISTCNVGTTIDTRLNVYCGSCDDLVAQACSDDPGCGVAPGTQASVQFCAAGGTEYYVLVHAPAGGDLGEFTLDVDVAGTCSDFDPACETLPVGNVCEIEDEMTCQLPDQMGAGEAGTVGATSDLNAGAAGFTVADNLTVNGDGTIESLCWWGFYIDFGGPSDCGTSVVDLPDDNFRVRFLADDGGLPGAVLATYELGAVDRISTTEPIPSSVGDLVEWEYTAQLSPAFSVTPGTCVWIEIVNDTATSPCFWLWETTSNQSDGISAQDVDNDGYQFGNTSDYDLSWCIDEPFSFDACSTTVGVCCIPDGSCLEDVTAAECDDAGGVFFADGSCLECPEFATYQYDDFSTETAIGGPGGDIAWIHRFDADGGSDTITEIQTVLGTAAIPGGSGVNPGETLGWAILNDDLDDSDPATATLLASGTVAIDAGAIETDVAQVIPTGSVSVSGSFFVVCWVTYPVDSFPAPVDSDTPDPTGLDAWFVGVDAGTFDPADLSGAALLSDIVSGVWFLRAD